MKEYIVRYENEYLQLLPDKMQELVRCKDCEYNDDGECIIKAGWFPVKPDWFCADGERGADDA